MEKITYAIIIMAVAALFIFSGCSPKAATETTKTTDEADIAGGLDEVDSMEEEFSTSDLDKMSDDMENLDW